MPIPIPEHPTPEQLANRARARALALADERLTPEQRALAVRADALADEIPPPMAVSDQRSRPGDLGPDSVDLDAAFRDLFGGADNNLTDLGNARRLLACFGGDVRWVPEWREWIAWDGKRWARDRSGVVERLAVKTLARMASTAAQLAEVAVAETMRALCKQLTRWAMDSESKGRLEAMVALAAVHVSEANVVHSADLDTDEWALNVENGTVDLRTGELRPHRKEDMLTRLCQAAYDPEATDPLWNEFIRRALPDDEGWRYFQLVMGSVINGLVTKGAFIFLNGPTHTSKSTTLEILKDVLGADYACNCDPEQTLLLRKQGPKSVRTDIARLEGKRLVVSSELAPGQTWDKEKIKSMSGGDSQTARVLYERQERDVKPTWTFAISANERPGVDGIDPAFWVRLKVVLFNQVHTDVDRQLWAKLRTPRVRQAVLAWLVRGAVNWYRDGMRLEPPAAVRTLAEQYQRETDPLAEWLEVSAVKDERGSVSGTVLRRSYDDWYTSQGLEPPILKRDVKGWTQALQAHGLRYDRRARRWLGVTLNPQQDGALTHPILSEPAASRSGTTRVVAVQKRPVE